MHVHILILTVFAPLTGLAPALHVPPHDGVACWSRRWACGGDEPSPSGFPPVDDSLLFFRRLPPAVPPPQVAGCQAFALHEDEPAAAPHEDEPAAAPQDEPHIGGVVAAAPHHDEWEEPEPHGLFQALVAG